MEEHIEIKIKGNIVRGMLHIPSARGKYPAVLLCHGYLSGDRRGRDWWHVKRSRELCKMGIASFRFDYRGVGESDGEFKNFSLLDKIDDAKEAFDFLSNHKKVNKSKIGVIGFSYGGITALNAFLDKNIKCLALVSTPSKTKDIENLKSKGILKPLGKDYHYREYVVSKKFLDSLDKVQSIELIKSFEKPLLIVQGTDDEILSPNDAEKWFKSAKAKDKTLRIIEGGNHNFQGYEINPRVRKIINEWLKNKLT